MAAGMMLALALPILVVAAVADPRPPIVELAHAGDSAAALAAAEQALAREPARARALGLEYLGADLLDKSGRAREAAEAFARAMAAPPALLPWARLRLARIEEGRGQPATAAGLAAALLAADPPEALLRPGLELLRRALAAGGDCRLLDGIRRERLPRGERRRLDLLRAECRMRSGRLDEARELALALLADETGDALARDAAELVAALPGEPRDRRSAELLGRAAYEHREFEAAAVWLERALAERPAADSRTWELGFALARSEFWLGRYRGAAERFQALAKRAPAAARRSSALHQAGRALELAGETGAATAAFLEAAAVRPSGEWTSASLLSALRLRALAGDEAGARALLARLAAPGESRSALARGALFLAAGDLVRGRTGGVADHLDQAARTHATATAEIAYWRGRLAELSGAAPAAVDRYLEALAEDPFHPFARASARRLSAPGLAAAVRARADAEIADGRPEALRRATLLPGGGAEPPASLRDRGIAGLERLGAAAPWLDWTPVPVADWPLWAAPVERPEDLLLGLGRFAEAAGAVQRHFPAARLPLAFTGALWLAEDGAVARSLSIAETLFERRPAAVPIEWVSPALRRLLYPFPWRAQIGAEAEARRVDPLLLVALIREESRFDPRALSPAAARGLTQFVLPTARRIAAQAGLAPPRAEDLDRPEGAIALGAGYLGELAGRFGGRVEMVAAAYNAGEEQAALWARYCFTQEPEEFLSKIGFRETRAYVQRVLGSREHYASLEGGAGAP